MVILELIRIYMVIFCKKNGMLCWFHSDVLEIWWWFENADLMVIQWFNGDLMGYMMGFTLW